MTANSQIETMVPGNVKLAMKDNGATSSDLWMVPVANLKMIEGFNVRQNTAEYRAHLTSITDMILENGFRKDKPLTGYVANEGGVQSVYITDGHTRLAGAIAAIARGASIEELPVVLVPKGTNKEDLTVGLVVSNTGKPLSPFEVGLVCKRLVDYGWEEKTIAKRLGFSGKYVNDLLSLLSAPKAVRDLVIAGRVSATLAIEELATNPEAAVERLTAAVEAVPDGKRATKKHVKKAAEATGVVMPKAKDVLRLWLEFAGTMRAGEPDTSLLRRCVKQSKQLIPGYKAPPAE